MYSDGDLLGHVPSARQADGESGELHGHIAPYWHVDVGRREAAQLALVLDGDGIADLQQKKRRRRSNEYSKSPWYPGTDVLPPWLANILS